LILSRLLAEKKLKTTPLKMIPNGLVDVEKWVQYHKEKKVCYMWLRVSFQETKMDAPKVSAEKITYRIGDTP
jgi:hypothetical protein